MNDGLFLLGAVREVGKTIIGVAIVALLREMGVNATMMTPISTGGAVESPTALLKRIGVEEEKRLVTPVIYETDASPYVASMVERRPVDIEKITAAFRELRSQGKFVVVEGGGVYVPFSTSYATIDLVEDLGLPSIIIGRTGRGTLNACLLTQRALTARGIHPSGFILNGFGQFGEGFVESMNPDVLEELAAPTPVLGVLEWRPDFRENPAALAVSLREQAGLMAILQKVAESSGSDVSVL